MRWTLGIAFAFGLFSCTQVPEDREDGAGRSVDLQGGLHELTHPRAAQAVEERPPFQVPQAEGGIVKDAIRPDGVSPVRSRGIEEDPHGGSRTEFLRVHMELVEQKSALEEEVLVLRRTSEASARELEKLRKQRAVEEAELARLRGELEMMEASLDQMRGRAEEERQKFLRAEEARLLLEIELVDLKTYLLQRGVPLPGKGPAGSAKAPGESGR